MPRTLAQISAEATQPGSENGPMGKWPRARLATTPEAGNIINLDGKLYVAIAGERREGYRGDYGRLYSRWVQIHESEIE